VIVGDGPLREALAVVARRLGVDGRVCFLATMPQAALCDVYSAADVLLLTSTREGWPNVVLEALACGTPVVAFDVGAVGRC
jgi:glycosyltransferase involved in cell wall biosynthesis